MEQDLTEVIPENERIPELEKEVKYFLENTPSSPFNKYKYSRSQQPSFKDDMDRIMWELEEIRRCRDGYRNMSGKMYFYFNYCWILNIEGGKIAPEYRVADNEWFNQIESCNGTEWGVVCVKRRRVGASWKEAADVLQDVLFNPFFIAGMNSKSEKDSIALFRKVKFLYDNLPTFLRVRSSAGYSKMHMDFSYYGRDENGNKKRYGNQSEIYVVAPEPTNFEGMMLNKWICDEAGKQEKLEQMWSYTEDCLMQETRRVGMPVIFGTSGDVGKDGASLVEMWNNSDAYMLKRFFFSGWMGIMTDEYGNDMKEDAIRWIVYKRWKMRNLNPKHQNTFKQKYPLTVEEAFSQASTGGVGDIIKINSQLTSLRENPPKYTLGKFMTDPDEEVIWKPNGIGPVIMYENKKNDIKYVAGCDPVDHDDTLPGASYQSLIIQSTRHGLEPNKVVLDYTDKPKLATEFYDQAILALLYYNKAKVLIERNRFRMIAHFDEQGYKYLLTTTPQGVLRLVGGRANTIGINMNDDTKEYGEGLIEEEIDKRVEYIPSVTLLQECIEYGARNTDRLMAWMISLIYLKDVHAHLREDKGNTRLPNFKYVKQNGKITRVIKP